MRFSNSPLMMTEYFYALRTDRNNEPFLILDDLKNRQILIIDRETGEIVRRFSRWDGINAMNEYKKLLGVIEDE